MKIASTGIDPRMAFKEFVKKDLIPPLEKESDKRYQLDARPKRSEEWALNTTKKSNSPIKVQKLQQYKDYFFPSCSIDDKIKFNKRIIDTDHQSDILPENVHKKTGMRFLEMKSR